MTVDSLIKIITARLKSRRFLAVTGGFTLLIIGVLVFIPFGIQMGISSYFLDSGMRKVEIEDVDFNPFSGRFHLRGLSAIGEGERRVELKHCSAEIVWHFLFSRRVRLRMVEIDGLQLGMEQKAEGVVHLGGIVIRTLGGEAMGGEGEPWGFAIDQLKIVNTTVMYTNDDFNSELEIDSLQLEDLMSWEPQHSARFSLTGKLNQAPLKLTGESRPFVDEPWVAGQLGLEQILLDPIQALVTGVVPRLKGQLTIDSAFKVELKPEGRFHWSTDGNLGTDALQLQTPWVEVTDKSTRWNGSMQGGWSSAAGLELDMNGSLNHQLTQVDLPKPKMKIVSSATRWKGRVQLTQGTQGLHLQVIGDLGLKQTKMDGRASDLGEVATEAVEISGLDLKLVIDKAGQLELSNRAKVMTNQLQLSDPQNALSLEKINWQGEVTLKGQALKVEGDVDLGHLLINHAGEQQAQIAVAALKLGKLRFKMDRNEAGGLQLSNHSDLRVDGMDLSIPQGAVQLAEVLWSGDFSLDQPDPDMAAMTLATDGRLGLKSFEGNLPDPGMALTNEQFEWNGRFALQTGGEAPAVTAEGSSQLDGITFRDTRSQVVLLALEQLKMTEVAITEGNRLAMAETAFKGLELSAPVEQKGERILFTESIHLRDWSFSMEDGLVIKQIEKQGIEKTLRRSSKGHWNVVAFQAVMTELLTGEAAKAEAEAQPAVSLQEAGKKLEETEEKPAQSEPQTEGAVEMPLPIVIDQIVWQGENKIHVRDDYVDPPFAMTTIIEAFEVEGIDSTQPEKLTSLNLKANLGRHSRLTLDAEYTPFYRPPSGHIKGEIDAFELPKVSAYSGDTIGYMIDSGELDLTMDFNLDKGQIAADNKIEINRLEVSPVSDEKAQKLTAKISMPLDTALGILEDKNDNIVLNIPVSGEMGNLQIDPSDVISIALGKAIKTGALVTLGAAFFPYGTAIALATHLAGSNSAVRLDPITFAVASGELEGEHRKYLQKVAEVLKSRPGIAIKLCGFATAADRAEFDRRSQEAWQAKVDAAKAEAAKAEAAKAEAAKAEAAKAEAAKAEAAKVAVKDDKSGVKEGKKTKTALKLPRKPQPVTDEKLLELARQRAESVEDFLVDKHAVDPSRTAVCRPELDKDEKAAPRVDVLI
ncbi:DUF748 domain-containing protein [endosymbiont of Lamellibrachia barhami]|uniref:DUF748 domain-containing protein n=1 Tax=endosymbiont of Lamellibrachia barhami TaxID=205975 RepID=UPI0015A76C1B|nr:DUF748 domain-containing protein [endosymbiont of Lamellibrachia barhami]